MIINDAAQTYPSDDYGDYDDQLDDDHHHHGDEVDHYDAEGSKGENNRGVVLILSKLISF